MYRQIIVRVCWLMSVLGSSHICQPLEDPVESSKLTLDDKLRLGSPMMKTLTRPPPWVRGVGCDVRSCPWCGRGLTGGATSSQQQSAASPRHCSIEIFPSSLRGVSYTGLKQVISSRGLLIVREILYSNQITYSNQHIKSYKNFLFILMWWSCLAHKLKNYESRLRLTSLQLNHKVG